MKMVVVLREPVARLKSAVTHMVRTQEVDPFVNLHDVVLGRSKHAGQSFSILENGLYHANLIEYLKVFPAAQLKILFFETDIVKQPLKTLRDVCEFLGVDFREEYFPRSGQKSNEYKMSKPALVLNHYLPWLRFANNRLNHFFKPHKLAANAEVIRWLEEYYAEPNLRLKEITGFIPENYLYRR
jgi:hypothetical protein